MKARTVGHVIADAVGDSQALTVCTFVMTANLMVRAGLVTVAEIVTEIEHQRALTRNRTVAARLDFLLEQYAAGTPPLLTVIAGGRGDR